MLTGSAVFMDDSVETAGVQAQGNSEPTLPCKLARKKNCRVLS